MTTSSDGAKKRKGENSEKDKGVAIEAMSAKIVKILEADEYGCTDIRRFLSAEMVCAYAEEQNLRELKERLDKARTESVLSGSFQVFVDYPNLAQRRGILPETRYWPVDYSDLDEKGAQIDYHDVSREPRALPMSLRPICEDDEGVPNPKGCRQALYEELIAFMSEIGSRIPEGCVAVAFGSHRLENGDAGWERYFPAIMQGRLLPYYGDGGCGAFVGGRNIGEDKVYRLLVKE